MENFDLTRSPKARSQKFRKTNVHQAVDANLEEAIKKNKVKAYIKKGLSDIQNIPTESGRNLGLEQHLLQLKNECSKVKREVQIKESETAKFRDEKKMIKEEGDKIKQERMAIEKEIGDLQRKVDQVSDKRDCAAHGSKSYEHVIERMKKDYIFFQLKNNQLTRTLKGMEKNLGLTQTQNYSITEMEKMSFNGLRDAQEQLEHQKHYRKQKYETCMEQNSRKCEKDEKLKEHQKKTEKIQELAEQIQDAELLRIKRFLTVQMLLKELLKNKISSMKKHFQPFENAFLTIKSNTSVKDATSFKCEFFNFENSYNEKAAWVRHLEAEIADSERDQKELQSKLAELHEEEMQMIEQLQGNEGEMSNINKRQLTQTSMAHEKLWHTLSGWLSMQAQKVKVDAMAEDLSQEALFLSIYEKLAGEHSSAKPAHCSDKDDTRLSETKLSETKLSENNVEQ